MSYNNREYVLNEEQVASFLTDAVSRVESATDADIKAFDQIKKLIKKNVPFSRRKYVYAYLVKQATQGFRSNRFNKDRNEHGRNDRHNDRRSGQISGSTVEKTERPLRVEIDPSQATTIFIGIGRNRSVFPRDLVGLLVSVAGLDRMRIGEIRVLSNYSFIQLFTEDCEKAISALNGYSYRGRKLSVSYSRKKEDGEDVPAEGFESSEAHSEPAVSSFSPAEERIPSGVTNEGHADTSVNSEEAKLAEEQNAFAKTMASSSSADIVREQVAQGAETTDDGQVKSHFGDGAAY